MENPNKNSTPNEKEAGPPGLPALTLKWLRNNVSAKKLLLPLAVSVFGPKVVEGKTAAPPEHLPGEISGIVASNESPWGNDEVATAVFGNPYTTEIPHSPEELDAMVKLLERALGSEAWIVKYRQEYETGENISGFDLRHEYPDLEFPEIETAGGQKVSGYEIQQYFEQAGLPYDLYKNQVSNITQLDTDFKEVEIQPGDTYYVSSEGGEVIATHNRTDNSINLYKISQETRTPIVLGVLAQELAHACSPEHHSGFTYEQRVYLMYQLLSRVQSDEARRYGFGYATNISSPDPQLELYVKVKEYWGYIFETYVNNPGQLFPEDIEIIEKVYAMLGIKPFHQAWREANTGSRTDVVPGNE